MQRDRNIEANSSFLQIFCSTAENKAWRKIGFYDLFGQLYGDAAKWKVTKLCEDLRRVLLYGAVERHVIFRPISNLIMMSCSITHNL